MAKFIIQTHEDLDKLQGKFVLQLDNHHPDKKLTQMDWGFAKEKRLKIVTSTGFTTLWGDVKIYETFEKFQNIFNYYLFPHNIESGKTDGGRFHRLLSPDEIDYLAKKIKEENYQ